MWSYSAFCDEFYVNTRLFMKLDLAPSRESVLHFMEQIRRGFPRMTRLRRRDGGSLVLDEDARDSEDRRFVRIDRNALRFGNFRPPDAEAVQRFAGMILHQAPAHLSLSDLDYDYMEVAFGFDLEYRGNHDELVADTLFATHPLLATLAGDMQVYVEVKGRTSTYEIRTGQYEANPLSVYLTVRRYWTAAGEEDPLAIHTDLLQTGVKFVERCAIPCVVQPLAAAIASRR